MLPAWVAEQNLDIVLIAEQPAGYQDGDIAALLSSTGANFTTPHRPPGSRILALSRLGDRFTTRYFDRTYPYSTTYWLDRRVTVVAAHLLSKREAEGIDQASEARRFAALIRDFEARDGDDHTIVVGDLNMDPFEEGMVSAQGLNALAFRGRRSAEVKRIEYPYFYNPMWSLWGDRTEGPPGTYHINRSSHHINRYWHMYDQLLLRPSMSDALIDLRIVQTIDGTLLLKASGWPEPSISDHLPLVATFAV